MRNVRRVGLALVSALLLSTALLAPGAASPPHRPALRAPFGLATSPNPAIAGEKVALTGRLSTRVARPVVLQQYTSGAWRKVAAKKSGSTGKFAFSVTAPAAARKYRVKATRTSRYRAITSSTRTLNVVAQSGTFTMPATIVRGESFVAQISFTPARGTRYVDVQEKVGDTWETFDTYRMDNDGTSAHRYGFDGVGTFTLRARARARNGAPAYATPAASITTVMPPAQQMMQIAAMGESSNGPAMLGQSADGGKVLWFRDPDGDGVGTYRLWDRATRVTTTVPGPPDVPGFEQVGGGSMTPDLRYGLFTAMVPVGDYPDTYQLYLWDRQANTATLISHDLTGDPVQDKVLDYSISDDGRFVTFASSAPGIVADDPTEVRDDVYLWDRTKDETTLVSGPMVDEAFGSTSRNPVISPDGSYVLYGAWLQDINPTRTDEIGIVRWNRASGTSSIVDLPGYDIDPGPNWPIEPISADGRWVLTQARDEESTITETVLWDTTTNATTPVPEAPTPSADGSTGALYPDAISADGSTVTGTVCGFRYDQQAQFLYEPCYAYVWTRSAGDPVLVSKHWNLANDPTLWLRESSGGGTLSGDGRYLVFGSESTALIPNDGSAGGIYTWDRDWTP